MERGEVDGAVKGIDWIRENYATLLFSSLGP